jgi:hypothetical protein
MAVRDLQCIYKLIASSIVFAVRTGDTVNVRFNTHGVGDESVDSYDVVVHRLNSVIQSSNDLIVRKIKYPIAQAAAIGKPTSAINLNHVSMIFLLY